MFVDEFTLIFLLSPLAVLLAKLLLPAGGDPQAVHPRQEQLPSCEVLHPLLVSLPVSL